MAGLQRKGDSWYCTFRYLGDRHTFTIGPVPDDIAEATGRKVDLLLYRLKQRLVEIPSGEDDPGRDRTAPRILREAWGQKFPINDLSLLKLQEYVDARTKDAGMNGRKVSAATIKKEIVTLRTAWNWAKRAKIVKEPFPYPGLRYPRTTEKPPFMTKAEVERRIKAGLTKAEEADLWDAMYPTTDAAMLTDTCHQAGGSAACVDRSLKIEHGES